MFATPFEGPRLKIAHARRHITQLREAVQQFGKETTIDWVWREPEDPNVAHMREVRFVFSKKPPSEIPLLIGDAVHNLRASLDIMLCDIARLREVGSSDVKFPFAESAEKLDERLAKRELAHLGEDVSEAIRSCAPYKGGHIGLRGLHDLDVADKHKLLLPTYVVAFATMPMMGLMTEAFSSMGVNLDFAQMRTPVHEGMEMLVAKEHDPKSFFKFPETGPAPVFGPSLPFAGEPVLETLEGLAQMTNEIVENFAIKVGGGGGGGGGDTNPTAAPSGNDPAI